MNMKYLETKLREIEVLLKDIDYIIITHTHSDHISSLPVLIKTIHPTVIVTKKMLKDLSILNEYDQVLFLENDLEIDNLKIESIPTSHDAIDSRGYIISEDNTSVVIITDTGYLNKKYFDKLYNKDLYIFESNHDIEMLLHGRYPKWLKQRVLSDVGHLSNQSASYYLSKLIGPNTKKIILAHLSEENNTPDMALDSIKEYFSQENIEFTNIVIANQFEITERTKI